MGLDLGEDFCFDNVRRIVARAKELDNFVRVDMEGSEYTERTISVYRRLRGQFDNAGLVVQAYLHRTKADVNSLIADGMGHFRLCKGACDSQTDRISAAPPGDKCLTGLDPFVPCSRGQGGVRSRRWDRTMRTWSISRA